MQGDEVMRLRLQNTVKVARRGDAASEWAAARCARVSVPYSMAGLGRAPSGVDFEKIGREAAKCLANLRAYFAGRPLLQRVMGGDRRTRYRCARGPCGSYVVSSLGRIRRHSATKPPATRSRVPGSGMAVGEKAEGATTRMLSTPVISSEDDAAAM